MCTVVVVGFGVSTLHVIILLPRQGGGDPGKRNQPWVRDWFTDLL